MKSKTSSPLKKKSVAAITKKPVKPAPPYVIPDHVIGTSQAKAMTDRFDANKKKLNKVYFYAGRQFHISLFKDFLKLKGVETLQFRNAVNDKNEHTLVITAADKNGKTLYLKMKTGIKKTLSSASRDVTPPGDTNGVGNMGNSCPEYPADSNV
jgi:hypothetical protein